jgi:hypothetical protein
MFAMLNGSWPRSADALDEEPTAVERAVRAQVAAGLDLVTVPLSPAFGRGPTIDAVETLVNTWQSAAAIARDIAPSAEPPPTVAAVISGPFTLAAHVATAAETVPTALRLHDALVALAEAGCTMVVVSEPAAVSIGDDPDARRRFRDAQRAMLSDEPPLHAMLAITGGSAWEAGAETILDAPYASYLLDLIAGPDNWYLARAVPGDRGIVCAALRAPSRADQAPALVWAANYAASINGRGLERVGLANASPLGDVDEADAIAALESLVRAARLAGLPPEEAIAAGLDRRTFGQPPERGARPRLPRA